MTASLGRFSADIPHPVALLLGAGGIRGCAHVGVFKVLDELNIDVDIVVGASIGSLFGAAFAARWDVQRIALMTARAPFGSTGRFYMNRLRIDDSTYVGRQALELGRETKLEDLPRRFICMATEAESGRVVPLMNGALLRSIEASIALPGVAQPVEIDGVKYIDGGLREAIPSRIAREAGARFVIRVDLCGEPTVPARVRKRVASVTTHFLASKSGRNGRVVLGDAGGAVRGQLRDTAADLIIQPKFYGLFVNSPVGVGFCSRQGERAMRRATGGLSDR